VEALNLKDINRMKRGNTKLYNMFIFDLPTSVCSTSCVGCYAKKAERMYGNTVNWRNLNLDVASDTKVFKKLIGLQLNSEIDLKKNKIRVVRLHSSGDFFSQLYINTWSEIIKKFSHFKFFAFTKVLNKFDFSGLTKLNNFNLIDSYITIDEKKYLNYGSLDYIDKLQAMDNELFLCPATTDSAVKCNKDCTYCQTNNKVLFKQH